MITALLGLLSGLVGWMLTHLPVSPFANLSWGDVDGFGGYSLQQLLAWVNWLLPFRDCLVLFEAWLAAVTVVVVVKYVKRFGLSIFGIKGSEE